MKTFIKTAHEERYSDGSKTLGIILNSDENNNRIDSLAYIYRQGMYIFFDTIMGMNDYLLYSDTKIRRSYVPEEDFDNIYDAPYIEGNFSEHLKWV